MTAPPPPRSIVIEALRELRSDSLDLREAALAKLETLAKEGLTTTEVGAFIAVASESLPSAKHDWRRYDELLLRAVGPQCGEAHVGQIVGAYSRLTALGQPAALHALAGIKTRGAALGLAELLREHGWPDRGYPAMLHPMVGEGMFEDVLLPAFSDGTIRGLPEDVFFHVLLSYGEAGKLSDEIAAAVRPRVARSARDVLRSILPRQCPAGIAWRWEEDYVEGRYLAGLLLDTLGHLGRSVDVVEILRQGLELQDPRPKMFALVSLVRMGETPAPLTVLQVASDPETRGTLFDRLSALGRRGLFPETQMTQEKLAESDMVGWLTYPAELGRAPDEIELMRTVERDLGPDSGVLVYYVFRFRVHPPHWAASDGWLAGVSGPFRRNEFPTTRSLGDTFSTFTKWSELSAEEHLASVTELLGQ